MFLFSDYSFFLHNRADGGSSDLMPLPLGQPIKGRPTKLPSSSIVAMLSAAGNKAVFSTVMLSIAVLCARFEAFIHPAGSIFSTQRRRFLSFLKKGFFLFFF